MPPHRRLMAPAANGEVLAVPNFDAIPALVEANRQRLDGAAVVIGGLPLRELRVLARREALELASPAAATDRSADGPLVLAGHQPELSHPGVWVKNFALNGLARKLGGTPLHLVVDNDTLRNTSMRFPAFRDHDPDSVHLEPMRFDQLDGDVTYEDRVVIDAELFRTFADRAAPLWTNWGYEPLLAQCWPPLGPNIGEAFVRTRRHYEREWGCDNLELPVSGLSGTKAFGTFAQHIFADLPRFRDVYNRAIRAYRAANGIRSANHPAPELGEDEAPFWVRTTAGQREHATRASDGLALRPRALTLTLFARLCLGDFFIHGIGGGKYDEVTDAIIRGYFGIEAPAYQVLSATLHLPLPGFPGTTTDVERAGRRVRDLTWNPQFYAAADHNPRVLRLIADRVSLATQEPPRSEHQARRDWFRGLQDLTTRLRELVTDQLRGAEADLARCQAEVRANAILSRRDFPWVLYPESTLRPFLQQFL